eukprot:TRINITY_DN2992_c0_g2_i2.p1 TRINITY_DN2992_c0_g2~~TRINITY_DN2992_c0_g2_i2.p1  ORF type:complete len:341 (+),score=136.53 TRINITY_DN2992_c0_g2_i2:51-1073(+)
MMRSLAAVALLATCAFARDIKITGNKWRMQDYKLDPTAVGGHGTMVEQSGSLFLFGGLTVTPSFAAVRAVSKLNLKRRNGPTRQWSVVNTMNATTFPQPWVPSQRGAVKVASVPNTVFYTCEDSQGGQVWKYDVNANEFYHVTTMPVPVEDCCAMASGDKIFIFGGDALETVVGNTQVYDVKTDTWTVGATMPTKLELMTCENVNDDVYLFGGTDDNKAFTTSVFKYNVAADTWTEYSNALSEGLYFNGAIFLPQTDYVLLPGGVTPANDFLSEVKVWNVATNSIDTSLNVPAMNENRGWASYALATCKRFYYVYATGGRNNFAPADFSDTTEVLKIKLL